MHCAGCASDNMNSQTTKQKGDSVVKAECGCNKRVCWVCMLWCVRLLKWTRWKRGRENESRGESWEGCCFSAKRSAREDAVRSVGWTCRQRVMTTYDGHLMQTACQDTSAFLKVIFTESLNAANISACSASMLHMHSESYAAWIQHCLRTTVSNK